MSDQGMPQSRISDYLERDNFKDPSTWVHLLLGIAYILILNLLLPVIGVLALIQFLIVLFQEKRNPALNQVNHWLVEFFRDSLNYITSQSDRKPFPFTIEVGHSKSIK